MRTFITKNARLRETQVYSSEELSREMIDEAVIDVSPKVREAIARRLDFTPTREQVLHGLSDPDHVVRKLWAGRNDWTLPKEDIEYFLKKEKNKEIYELLAQKISGLNQEIDRSRQA